MQEQAAHLADVVSVFKTSGSTVAAHAAPAPARTQQAPVGHLALAGV